MPRDTVGWIGENRRAPNPLHRQKGSTISVHDILELSPVHRVIRHWYFVSFPPRNSILLNSDVPGTHYHGDLETKNSESLVALRDNGPINVHDINTEQSDDDKLNGLKSDRQRD